MPQNNTNLISYGSVGQKSDKALPGLKFSKGFLSGSFGEESTFKLMYIIDKVQYHVVVGVRSPFPSCLLAGATFSF